VVRAKVGFIARVGIDLQAFALPGAGALALIGALGPARTEDVTGLVGTLRIVKSAREMEYVRTAGRFAEAGRMAARAALRPGITEHALVRAIEAALRDSGSEYSAMPVFAGSGPRSASNHATPTERVIEAGDVVHVDFAGVSGRYHADTMQTFSVGAPNERAREVYAICLESLRAGIAATRVGIGGREVALAAEAPLRNPALEGMTLPGRFGYGLSAAYPPSWIDPLAITPESTQMLEPGMVFVLHQAFQFPDEGLGVIVGGTYALTDGGLEVVTGGDLELEVV
jgi:Xaa-Pro dipeptidase